MEPEVSLPHLRATCLYPVPHRSSPHPTSRRSILILSRHLRVCLPSGLLHPGFHIKSCMHLSSHVCYVPCPCQIIFDIHLKLHSAWTDHCEVLQSFSLCNLFIFLSLTLLRRLNTRHPFNTCTKKGFRHQGVLYAQNAVLFHDTHVSAFSFKPCPRRFSLSRIMPISVVANST